MLFAVGWAAGGAQVVRGPAQLSGGVQSLLLRVAGAADSAAGRESASRPQPPLPAVQLRRRRLPADVRLVDLRQHHDEVQAATSAGRRSRAGTTQRIHSCSTLDYSARLAN